MKNNRLIFDGDNFYTPEELEIKNNIESSEKRKNKQKSWSVTVEKNSKARRMKGICK